MTTVKRQNVFNSESKKSQPVKGKGKGRKSKVTAAKVALMKIKMSATGDRGVPDTERVYLRVVLPAGTATRSKPMYFSKVNTESIGLCNYKQHFLYTEDHSASFCLLSHPLEQKVDIGYCGLSISD